MQARTRVGQNILRKKILQKDVGSEKHTTTMLSSCRARGGVSTHGSIDIFVMVSSGKVWTI